jgi:hypothetical protein
MRSFLAAAAILAGLAAPAAAGTEFVGEAIFTSGTAACNWDPRGDYVFARLRPMMAGNGDRAEFSIIARDNARSYVLPRRNFDATLRWVQQMEIHSGFYPGDFGTRVAFTAQSPATITATTNFVLVVGKIENFDQVEGCVATFNMVLTRRIN